MTDLTAETDEGAQELKPRSETSPEAEALEQGADLRGISHEDVDVEVTVDETMIIYMVPQNPLIYCVMLVLIVIFGD
jgi:hypothetical protein